MFLKTMVRWEVGKIWEQLHLDDNINFYWVQIIHRIHSVWEEMLLECGNNISYLISNKHHLTEKHQIYCLEKLNSRELYN